MPETPLSEPFDAVFFDCDSTLTTVEGIDVLSHYRGVYEQVKRDTQECMSHGGLTPDLYAQRLDLIRPTKHECLAMAQAYKQSPCAGAAELINVLKQLGKHVFVMSAGVNPAVKSFAEWLGVPEECVMAVDLFFSEDGAYSGFNDSSPLLYDRGKRDLVSQCMQKYGLSRTAFVGDGMNDVCTRDVVDLFIGFGGVDERENVRALSDVYVTSPDLRDMIPLLLTQDEIKTIV